jgi:4-amino-4-deoxy-L-arabinose transferase-like glycosyltransferase
VLVLASAWRADWRLWRGMHWASGLAIFLLLAAPWFVLVSLRNPDFLQFFFVHEHFQRYLTTEHNRVGAWWYYLPLFVLGMLPWTSALPWLWPRGALAGRRGALAPADLLVVWSAFVLLFFSASGSKLPSYILPMFPALALLVGLALRTARTDLLRWHLMLPVGLWLLALAGSTQIGRLASRNIELEELLPIGIGIRAGAAMFLMAALFAWHFLGRRRVTAALLCVALGQTLAMAILLQSYETFSQGKSAADMVAALAPQLPPGTPVFAVRSYDQSLPFYLGRQVTLVDYEDEFAMGERIEPERYIHSLDDFVARWQVLPQAAAYMEFPSFLELRQRGVPMRIVFQDRRRVLVVKR